MKTPSKTSRDSTVASGPGSAEKPTHKPWPKASDRTEVLELGERIAVLAAQISAATYQLLAMLHEFDQRDGWSDGFRSCAHWLSWRTGLALGPAREKLRVARALAELPRTSDEMRRGEISYSKVRALTRVATPENEDELLEFARAGTASHVERVVRAWRRIDREIEREQEAAQHESRYLQVHAEEDGMYVVRGRLTPEVGAVLMRALEAGADALYDQEREREKAATDGVPPAQRRADAIGRVAEAALAGGLDKGTRGDRYQVVVHVDAEVLAESEIDDTGAALEDDGVPAGTSRRIVDDASKAAMSDDLDSRGFASGQSVLEGESVPAGTSRRVDGEGSNALVIHDSDSRVSASGQSVLEGGNVPAGTSRRIACDASKVVMKHDSAGRVLDVGRRTRVIPPAIRRALDHRDQGCQFPGCGLKFCDAHHVRHWAEGGSTKLDNLVLLCRRHHRSVHEEGYRVEPRLDGTFRFLRPDGRPLPTAPPPPRRLGDPQSALPERLSEAGVDLNALGASPLWDGSPLDLALAIEGLIET